MTHLNLKRGDLDIVVKALGSHFGHGGEYTHAQTLKTIISHISDGHNHVAIEFGRWEDDQRPAPAPVSAAGTSAPAVN